MIDGVKYNKTFEGKYFSSTPIQLDIEEEVKPRFRYWLVNDKKITARKAVLRLQEDTLIKLVLSQ